MSSDARHDQMELGRQMIAEWLFVESVDDLRRRSKDPGERSRYELLGIAPILRKLFIDGSPLVNTVRRGHRDVPLEFRIRPWRPSASDTEHPDMEWFLRRSGHELVGESDAQAIRGIDKFLRTRIGLAGSKDATVRDVVLYFANVEGGVHHGVPREEGHKRLSQLAVLLLGNSNSPVETLAYLAQVAVAGLAPLREAVLRSPLIIRGLHMPNPAGGYFENHWTEEYRRMSAGS